MAPLQLYTNLNNPYEFNTIVLLFYMRKNNFLQNYLHLKKPLT